MNLREMMDAYSEEGLTRALAASRVCQDIGCTVGVRWNSSRKLVQSDRNTLRH